LPSGVSRSPYDSARPGAASRQAAESPCPYFFFAGADELVKQANRQLDAVRAAGTQTPIRWEIAEYDAYVAMKKLFADKGVTGITLVHTP
jgi:hypothetical protein